MSSNIRKLVITWNKAAERYFNETVKPNFTYATQPEKLRSPDLSGIEGLLPQDRDSVNLTRLAGRQITLRMICCRLGVTEEYIKDLHEKSIASYSTRPDHNYH